LIKKDFKQIIEKRAKKGLKKDKKAKRMYRRN